MIRRARTALAATAACLVAATLAPDDLRAQAPTQFPPEVAEENRLFDASLFDALEYRMIGPYRGGRVTTVEGVPSKPHTFYMGGVGGGVWRTTDAGETWEPLTDGQIAVGSIGDVKVAPSDPNVIYVGTGSASTRGNVSVGNGVYRSTDAGKTWEHLGLPEAGQIGNMVVHPDDPDRVWVAALGHIFGPNEQRGIFRTIDGGQTWEKVLFVSDSTGFVDVEASPENPRVLYAAAWRAERKPWTMISGAEEGGIWRSTDGGDSWEKLEEGLPEGEVGKIGLDVSPANPDRVWALIEAKDPEGGLYRSDDGGDSWIRVNRNRELRQRAWYYTYIEAHPTDENTLWAMNAGYWKSIDGGKTFERKPTPHGDNHDLWIHPENPEIQVQGNDGGVNVTVNGGETWTTQLNQPTAELYSVTVDDGFPYRVYAPQQDNSTISLPSTNPGGITPKQHWFSVGGCETGPIALNPDDPSTIWSGCYSGTLDRWSEATGDGNNVRIYPEIQIGEAPKDLRYRFQWNAPIEMSPHDPDVVYHGSQFVHRTEDGGTTWETISPDLTDPDPAKLEAAGEPITHDETGVEVYHTTLAIQESPHEAGTIWVGTNDGRVHLTRDGGESWTEITPDGMPEEGTVNRIEISPHHAGEAFLAVYRYRVDDFSPYIFHTENHGRDWELLTDGRNGIPDGYPTRVVREDPEREGLLYAGTEFGPFLSFDDGAHWQSLQLELPATPVTDLKVHRGDLVVATQGRSLWILDDLGPLRQLTREVADSDAWLYAPRDAWRADLGGGWGGERWPESAPDGALFRYWFADAPEDRVTLEIVDADGKVVRAWKGETDDDGDEGGGGVDADDGDEGEAADDADGQATDGVEYEDGLPVGEGSHAFTWNLRSPGVDQPDDVRIWGFTGGYEMAPGTYTVRLTAGDWSRERSFEVNLDPRVDDVTTEDLRAQQELAAEIHDGLDRVYDQLRRVRRLRKQVKDAVERAEEVDRAEGLSDRADSLVAALTGLEERITQTKNESSQDPLNFPPQLDARIASVYGYVVGLEGPPTEGARDRWEDLRADWAELRREIETLVTEEVGAFADTLEERGVPAVVLTSTSEGGE
jgi:photosystem II stability/assembly factor-like uncharacterized protein